MTDPRRRASRDCSRRPSDRYPRAAHEPRRDGPRVGVFAITAPACCVVAAIGGLLAIGAMVLVVWGSVATRSAWSRVGGGGRSRLARGHHGGRTGARRRGARTARAVVVRRDWRAASCSLVDYLGQTFGVLVPLQAVLLGSRVAPRGRRADLVPAPDGRRLPAAPRRHRRVVGRSIVCDTCCRGCGSSTGLGRRGSSSARTAGWPGSWSGFISQDHPDDGVRPHGRQRPEPAPAAGSAGRCTSGSSPMPRRTVRVRITAVTWPGNRSSIAFHRAIGFQVDDGPGTRRSTARRPTSTTTARARTGSCSSGTSERELRPGTGRRSAV